MVSVFELKKKASDAYVRVIYVLQRRLFIQSLGIRLHGRGKYWFSLNKISVLFIVTISKFDNHKSTVDFVVFTLALPRRFQIWAKRQFNHRQGHLIYVYCSPAITNYNFACTEKKIVKVENAA